MTRHSILCGAETEPLRPQPEPDPTIDWVNTKASREICSNNVVPVYFQVSDAKAVHRPLLDTLKEPSTPCTQAGAREDGLFTVDCDSCLFPPYNERLIRDSTPSSPSLSPPPDPTPSQSDFTVNHGSVPSTDTATAGRQPRTRHHSRQLDHSHHRDHRRVCAPVGQKIAESWAGPG